jgi:hypothetical protein
MDRFTVAELNKVITALNKTKLSVLSCSSSHITASIHDIEQVQKNLDLNTNGTTYALMPSGELEFKTHQNINDLIASGALAAGDVFFNKQNKITALSNYTADFGPIFLVLSILQQHDTTFVSELQLMHNNPPNTFLITEAELTSFLNQISPQLVLALNTANKPATALAITDEDEEMDLEDECFELETTSCLWPRGSAVSRIGLFGTENQNHPRICSTSPPENNKEFMALMQRLELEEQVTTDSPGLGG